tara:strand:- start:71 stop:202 length:132 start_codon:yes stop_codon:yes gene_type:complete
MKIEIKIEEKKVWGDMYILLTDKNGETLSIFNEEAISFFKGCK